MEIKELIRAAHKNAKEKGFHDKQRPLATHLMLIVGELAECLEADREGRTARTNEIDDCVNMFPFMIDGKEFNRLFERDVKGTIEEEIADTFIRLGDLCGLLDIDIEKIIEYKMLYNSSREKMHGKRY